MLIPGEKMVMSAEVRRIVTWFIYFLNLLYVRYNCPTFHHCRICGTDFREGGLFDPSPHPWAVPKTPILNRVKWQPHKIVRRTQTICWLLWKNCLSVFDHFVVLAPKGLKQNIYNSYNVLVVQKHHPLSFYALCLLGVCKNMTWQFQEETARNNQY